MDTSTMESWYYSNIGETQENSWILTLGLLKKEKQEKEKKEKEQRDKNKKNKECCKLSIKNKNHKQDRKEWINSKKKCIEQQNQREEKSTKKKKGDYQLILKQKI